jgi:hypothetical protein
MKTACTTPKSTRRTPTELLRLENEDLKSQLASAKEQLAGAASNPGELDAIVETDASKGSSALDEVPRPGKKPWLLLELPNEVLILIGERLPRHSRALVNFSSGCKLLREVIRPLVSFTFNLS